MIRQKKSFHCRTQLGISLATMLLASTVAIAAGPQRATVRIEQPDLIVKASDISFRPSSPRADDNVDFDIVVLNLGRVATRARILCELIATDRSDERVTADKAFRAAIEANRSHVVHWRVKMPHARRIQLSVKATVESAAADANETNNQAVITVTGVSSDAPPEARVRVTPPSLPDLTVSRSDIAFEPANPRVGEDVRVSVLVHNIGPVDSTDARVNFYLHVDGRIVDSHVKRGFVPHHFNALFELRFRMPRGRQVFVTASVGDTNDGNRSNGIADRLIRNKGAR